MLREDKNLLTMLVKEYSMKEVIHAPAVIASENADELSDMSLKERAITMANNSDTLYEMADKIRE